MREGQVRSLQYDLPEDGLTLNAHVDGQANVYVAYTIRNPTYVTADFVNSGSGLLSFHVESSTERQDNSNRVFASLAAKVDNTTITANSTSGDTAIRMGKFNNCNKKCMHYR